MIDTAGSTASVQLIACDDEDAARHPRLGTTGKTVRAGISINAINEVTHRASDAVEASTWTLASFATTPQPELGNRAPVDAFADADIEPLILSAHRTVADLKH